MLVVFDIYLRSKIDVLSPKIPRYIPKDLKIGMMRLRS